MFCRKCGNELKENEKFCTKCGRKVEEVKEKTNKKGRIKVKHVLILGATVIIVGASGNFLIKNGFLEDIKYMNSAKEKATLAVSKEENNYISQTREPEKTIEQTNTTSPNNSPTGNTKPTITPTGTIKPSNSPTTTSNNSTTIVTSSKKEFKNGYAWSKLENQLVCINSKGEVVLKLDSKYKNVTEVNNNLIIASTESYKDVLNLEGKVIISENDERFDKILNQDTISGYFVVSKDIDTYQIKETRYGLIDSSGKWKLELTADNAFLNDFVTGIDKGIMSTQYSDKSLYFVETGKKIKTEMNTLIHVDNTTIMYKDDWKTIYTMDKNGENKKAIISDAKNSGKYSDGLIYCSGDKKAFYNIKGEIVLDVTDNNISNLPRFEGEYAGITLKNNGGTMYYTIINKKGEFQFEPIKCTKECNTVGKNRFFVTYTDKTTNKDVSCIINEKGDKVFTANSITDYINGYAIKDEQNYVDLNGKELTLTSKK